MSIRLTFLGAAGCVTGSAYLVETSQARVLVDFGVFQGFAGADGRNVVPEACDLRNSTTWCSRTRTMITPGDCRCW
jgi:predicted metal-dependent RNase